MTFGDFIVDRGWGPWPTQVISNVDASSSFMAPVWLRKNFFYPHTVSPYLGVGTAFLRGNLQWKDRAASWADNPIEDKARQFVPMVGGGIEFFPGRFLHPRLEVRYLPGPHLRVRSDYGSIIYRTSSLFYSFALSTSW